MLRRNKQKIVIFIKLVVFNLFFIGFVANLISYLNSNWIESDSYAYGLFEYCRKVDGSVSYLVFRINEKRLVHNLFSDLQCISWGHQKPKFLNKSIYCLSFALVLHFVTMMFVVIYTIVANHSCSSHWYSKNPSNTRLAKFFSKFSLNESLCLLVGFALGLIISIAYGSNLTSIIVGRIFGPSDKIAERFGWCFWLSCAGFLSTLLPVLVLSLHTFFKKLDIQNRQNRIEASFESDSLSYESFNAIFNIRNTDLNKIFYSDVINNIIYSVNESRARENPLPKRENFLMRGFSYFFNSKKQVKCQQIQQKPRRNPSTQVNGYEFFKKTIPTLRQSDLYEPVRAIENFYSQIYSVVKLPAFQK